MKRHSWESHEFDRGDEWNADSDDDGLTEQQRAGNEFVELLLQQYLSGVITATCFCLS